MQRYEGERYITSEVVVRLKQILPFSADQIVVFDRHARIRQTAQGALWEINLVRNRCAQKSEDALRKREERSVRADNRVSQTEEKVKPSVEDAIQNRDAVIWGRIKVKLTGKVPLFLKLLKVFNSPQHPLIGAALKEKAKAKERIGAQKKEILKRKEELNSALDKQAAAVRFVQADTETAIVKVSDRTASLSREVIKRYGEILSQRKGEAAGLYANRMAFSDEEITGFSECAYECLRSKRMSSTHIHDWFLKRSWIGAGRAPTQQELQELPEDLKTIWRNQVRRSIIGE